MILIATVAALALTACQTTEDAAKKASAEEKHIIAPAGKALEFRNTSNNVKLYKYPGKDGHVLGRISTRFVVPVVEKKGDWMRIKGTTSYRQTWVNIDDMGEVTDKY